MIQLINMNNGRFNISDGTGEINRLIFFESRDYSGTAAQPIQTDPTDPGGLEVDHRLGVPPRGHPDPAASLAIRTCCEGNPCAGYRLRHHGYVHDVARM